jgi:hypothetical protein
MNRRRAACQWPLTGKLRRPPPRLPLPASHVMPWAFRPTALAGSRLTDKLGQCPSFRVMSRLPSLAAGARAGKPDSEARTLANSRQFQVQVIMIIKFPSPRAADTVTVT